MRQMFLRVMALIAALSIFTVAAHAQDMGTVTRNTYFIAPDANGVQQIYQLLLDGTSQPRQVTTAESDVITFGVSGDGLALAYISSGQVWLQSVHTEDAEALATVSTVQFFTGPVFDADGEYLAYADNGVWLVDLATRETRQLLADVPVMPDGSNMAEFRIYQPEMFVRGADGTAAYLVVDVGIWEWNTAGIYDLAADTFELLEQPNHTGILPLYGDRVLIYGNNAVAGEPALRLADSLETFNDNREVLRFSEVTDETLFATDALQIAPAVVRITGFVLPDDPLDFPMFYLDYNVMEDTVEAFSIFNLPNSQTATTAPGMLSPDGSILPVYTEAIYTDFSTIFGEFRLIDLATGETIEAAFPETIGIFRWQP